MSKKKKIFIICTVRNATQEYNDRLNRYVWALEFIGHKVHLPHRDTDQSARGFDICSQNMKAIKASNEVHIFYNGTSQGTHFDMGVAFAFGKKMVIVENEPLTEGKSYQRMLTEWEKEL